jgi:anaerobic nitric oxide reductase transcription regulator
MLRPLLDIARDLTAHLASHDRYRRLLEAVQRIVACEVVTLMRLEQGRLRPVAQQGLAADVFARRFDPAEHPRLARILEAAGQPVRFPADTSLPDPFDDALTPQGGSLGRIHACLGCALTIGDEIVGVLTLDDHRPDHFLGLGDDDLAGLAALAAAALHTAGLVDALEAAARRQGLVARQLLREVQQRQGQEIIGQSPATRRLVHEIETVAETDLPVLLQGETGVGKEVAARAIHARSARRDAPLIYVNCAALPESIAESELFGHTRGAFTGATDVRAGKFEAADGGTLFLDEIGELPLSIQPKLLRVLQSGELQRLGSDKLLQVDVRILTATNRNLVEEVALGHFRADLFHRLSVYPIDLPPLRARGDDILTLAGFFLDGARTRLGLGPVRLTPAAGACLMRYDWPGNVRELEHTMIRAAVRAAGGRRREPVWVDEVHLGLSPGPVAPPPPEKPVPTAGVPLREAVDTFQRDLIRRHLEAAGGNWSEVARRLDVDRGNLHRLARRLGVESPAL